MKKATGTEPCDLCGQELRRTKDSKLCITCHVAIERFFLLYFCKYKLRQMMPREVIETLRGVVRSILEGHEIVKRDEYVELDSEAYLQEVILDSKGREAKLRRKKATAAGN